MFLARVCVNFEGTFREGLYESREAAESALTDWAIGFLSGTEHEIPIDSGYERANHTVRHYAFYLTIKEIEVGEPL